MKISFTLSVNFNHACLCWLLFLFLKMFICLSNNLSQHYYGVSTLTVLIFFENGINLKVLKINLERYKNIN